MKCLGRFAVLTLFFLFPFEPNLSAQDVGHNFPCPSQSSSSSSALNLSASASSLSMGSLLQGTWSCTRNFFMGVWDSTGGLISGGINCVTSPIDCASSAADALSNVWTFMSNLVDSVNQMSAAISNLSFQQKIDLICDLVGAIGADVAIAILTAGSGTGKLAVTISKITAKISSISTTLRFISVSHRRLARLSSELLTKVQTFAELGYGRFIRRSIQACPI